MFWKFDWAWTVFARRWLQMISGSMVSTRISSDDDRNLGVCGGCPFWWGLYIPLYRTNQWWLAVVMWTSSTTLSFWVGVWIHVVLPIFHHSISISINKYHPQHGWLWTGQPMRLSHPSLVFRDIPRGRRLFEEGAKAAFAIATSAERDQDSIPRTCCLNNHLGTLIMWNLSWQTMPHMKTCQWTGGSPPRKWLPLPFAQFAIMNAWSVKAAKPVEKSMKRQDPNAKLPTAVPTSRSQVLLKTAGEVDMTQLMDRIQQHVNKGQ